jgi:hypothetical protein
MDKLVEPSESSQNSSGAVELSGLEPSILNCGFYKRKIGYLFEPNPRIETLDISLSLELTCYVFEDALLEEKKVKCDGG